MLSTTYYSASISFVIESPGPNRLVAGPNMEDFDVAMDSASPRTCRTVWIQGRSFQLGEAVVVDVKQQLPILSSPPPAIKKEVLGGSIDSPIIIDKDETDDELHFRNIPINPFRQAAAPKVLEFQSVEHLVKALLEWLQTHPSERPPGGLYYNKHALKESVVRSAAIGHELGKIQRFQIDKHYMGWMLNRKNGNVLYIRRPLSASSGDISAWLGGDEGFAIKFTLSGLEGSVVQIQEITEQENEEASSVESEADDLHQPPSARGSDVLFPDYARGKSQQKGQARKILTEGKPAITKCKQCIELGIECVVRKGNPRCAYCSSVHYRPAGVGECEASGENVSVGASVDLGRLNLPANSQSINHRTSIRGKVIDSVKSRSSNARVQISVENNQMSFPVYAKGSSDHKITAQNIIRHGYPAVVKCERCHKSGLDCIVSKHHRSCAYCTSELNPWAEGCNALREVTKEVKPELQISYTVKEPSSFSATTAVENRDESQRAATMATAPVARPPGAVTINPFRDRLIPPNKTPIQTPKYPITPVSMDTNPAKRLKTAVHVTARAKSKSIPTPFQAEDVQPPIFNFGLADASSGTIPRTLASCNTSEAFFCQAREAYEMFTGPLRGSHAQIFTPTPVKKEKARLLAVRVSWNGSRSSSIVPWGSDDSWDAMVAKVRSENEARGGGLNVEAQCLGRV